MLDHKEIDKLIGLYIMGYEKLVAEIPDERGGSVSEVWYLEPRLDSKVGKRVKEFPQFSTDPLLAQALWVKMESLGDEIKEKFHSNLPSMQDVVVGEKNKGIDTPAEICVAALVAVGVLVKHQDVLVDKGQVTTNWRWDLAPNIEQP